MKGLQINHCMYIRDLLCKGSRGFKQTYLLATVQKKFCLKCPLGERGGDRAHTAGDKQSKAELGSNESPTLRLCTKAQVWPWQGSGGGDVTTLQEGSVRDRTIAVAILGDHRSLC